MWPRLISALIALSCALLPAPAVAQTPTSAADPPPELDVRIGALWPEAGSEARPAFGMRLALRPWPSVASGRLALHLTGDFRSFGGNEGFDDDFLVRRRIVRNRLVAGASVGSDIVRTSRTTVDVRGGAALVRTRTNFLIDSSQGFAADGNLWENVCPFEGFKERCSTDYRATGLLSVGARRTLAPGSLFFVGVDYTALGIGQHILVGTFGLELR